MKFKISIIIPTYNSEKFIDRTLRSVSSQSIGFENLEVIIVDDCSTDETRKIINEYSSKYENFKTIYLSKNMGHPGIPRNIGIKEASADYLMFLDHDDIYESNCCETLYEMMTSENADFVSGTYVNIYDNGTIKNRTPSFFINKGTIKVNTIDEMKELFYIPPSIWTKIFKKSFILENNIEFPPILGEDAVFVTKSLVSAKKIIYLSNYVACKHILSENSTTNKVTVKYFEETMESEREIYNIFKELNVDYFKIRLLESLDFFLSQLLSNNLNKSENFLKAINFTKWYLKICKSYNISPKKEMNKIFFNLLLYDEIEAILIFKKFVNKQKMNEKKIIKLRNYNKTLELKVSNIHTTKGWIRYKILNILKRTKKKFNLKLL
ncbi:MAG: glycosyltransferase [Methanobrevibacter sp.]|nr:glycosyltransferase [Methanobrevibacter sp.]